MHENLAIEDSVISEMEMGRGLGDHLDPRGFFHIVLERDGDILAEFDAPNGIVNTAKNNILDAYFNLTGRQSAWYIALINNNSYSALSASDTIGSHAGWIEFSSYTANSGSTTQRAAWGQGSASGQAVTNGTAAVFTFTGNGTLQGVFITADPTKTGTGAMLWSTALFNSTLNVQAADILRVTYTVQM